MNRIMLGHSTPPSKIGGNHLKIIFSKPQTGDENEKNSLWMLFDGIPVDERSRISGFI
jgi:hypothetical protein